MMGDRGWMYDHLDDNGCYTDEFKIGVESFLDYVFSMSNPEFCCRNRIKCPCSNGFMNGYLVWLVHGEQPV
ncbi:hypothetical protein SLA2020_059040 [Shorea laevis]